MGDTEQSISHALIAFTRGYEDQYDAIWKQICKVGEDKVSGKNCVDLFRKSGLSTTQLAQIWELVDTQNTGSLDRNQFFIALGLISLAEDGYVPTIDRLDDTPSLHPPHLDEEDEDDSPSTPHVEHKNVNNPTPGVSYIIRMSIGDKAGTVRKHTEFIVLTDPVDWTVYRRYKDFEWLKDSMEKMYPYSVIPQLPEKRMSGRFEEKFLDERKRALQRFLNILAQHPVLGKSELLKIFLRDDEKSFKNRESTVRDGAEDLTPYQAEIDHSKPPPPDAEAALVNIRNYINMHEKKLLELYKLCQKITTDKESMADDFLVFGRMLEDVNFTESKTSCCWTNACDNCNVVQVGLVTTNVACARIGSRHYQQGEEERFIIVDNVRDLIFFIRSLKEIYKHHDKKTLEHSKKLDQAKSKMSELKLKNANKVDKIDKSQREIQDLENKHARNNSITDFITNTLISETARFHEFKLNTLGMMLTSFTESQIKYYEALANVWRELGPALDKMPKQASN